MAEPEVLLFDLGGVLVDFAGVRSLPAMIPDGEESDIRQRWLSCPLVRKFETGQLSSRAFAELFIEKWDVRLLPEEFLSIFQSWIRGLYPSAEAMLRHLRHRYRLAALSNSNELHWHQMEHVHHVFRHFERAISSHQVGLHKPDAGIYRYALQALDVSANKVGFFDDTPANVAAAEAVGIQAWHTEGIDALQRTLHRLGFLEATFLSDTNDHET